MKIDEAIAVPMHNDSLEEVRKKEIFYLNEKENERAEEPPTLTKKYIIKASSVVNYGCEITNKYFQWNII